LFEVYLGLLSFFYLLGLTCRKLVVKPKGLPFKVISVGNITLGGTGKTPAVIAIAKEAKERGLQPCILTRGYKGKSKGPCLVVSYPHMQCGGQEGINVCTGIDAGDEPVLMASRLKDVPVIKCADRYKGGLFALNSLPVTRNPSLVFILDDGFQHRALHRDIDILLIDATNPFGNERLFPEGRLREPLTSIKRANIIALTKTDLANEETISAIKQKIKKYNPVSPVFTASHKPTTLIDPSGGSLDLDTLKDRKIYAFSGIANGEYFRDILTAGGADIVNFKSFRDHHIYKQHDMDKIKTEALGLNIITTEKDLVKIRELCLPENLFALRIEFEIDRGFYDKLFNAL
jgi:tetraacyldisaccharide 4'-kinase